MCVRCCARSLGETLRCAEWCSDTLLPARGAAALTEAAAPPCGYPPATRSPQELDPDTRGAYQALHDSARAAVAALLAGGGDGALLQSYSSILARRRLASVARTFCFPPPLPAVFSPPSAPAFSPRRGSPTLHNAQECLMRLRQCACAASLVPADRLQAARSVAALIAQRAASKGKGAAPLPAEEAAALFAALAGKLAQQEESECAICLEAATAETIRILRTCKRAFCRPCLAGVVAAEQGRSRCPLCRAPFSEEARWGQRTAAPTSRAPLPPAPRCLLRGSTSEPSSLDPQATTPCAPK